jgi:hypothetical protein
VCKGQYDIDRTARSSVNRMALSHEEKISKFVGSIDKKLQKMDSTYSHLSVILSNCGWQKKGTSNLREITDALEERDIYADPELTKNVSYAAIVHFQRGPWVKGLRLAKEDHLRDFLIENFSRIDGFSDLEQPKAEVYLKRSGNKIDILCRDRVTGAYVVIELKQEVGKPVTQIGDYMAEVKRDRAKGRFDVKGIVITGEPIRLASALSDIDGFPVKWLTYSIDLTLAES